MQLNPYNFRQYLAKPGVEPQHIAWLVFLISFAFLVWWSTPFLAPDSVALHLPRASAVSLKNPPSAFVVYTGNGFIYNNRLLNFTDLKTQLAALKDHRVLLLAAASSATLQEILPLLQRLETLGFGEVAFTVRP